MSSNSGEFPGAWTSGIGASGPAQGGLLYSDGSQQFAQAPGYGNLHGVANAFSDTMMVQRGASWTAGQTSYHSPLSGLQPMQLGLGPRAELGLTAGGGNFAAAQQHQQQWLAMAGTQVANLGSSPPGQALQQATFGASSAPPAGAGAAAGRPISSKNPFAAMPRALRNNQLRSNLLAAAGSFTDMAGGSSARPTGGMGQPPPPIRHSSLPADASATAAAVAAAQRLLSSEDPSGCQQQQHVSPVVQPPPPPPPQQQQQATSGQQHQQQAGRAAHGHAASGGVMLSNIEEEPAAAAAEEVPAEPRTASAGRTATPPAASPSSGRRSLTGEADASGHYLQQQQQQAAAVAQRLGCMTISAGSSRDCRDFGVERSVFSDPLLYVARPQLDQNIHQTPDVSGMSDQQQHHSHYLPSLPVPRSVSDPTVLMVHQSAMSFTSARPKSGSKVSSGFYGPSACHQPAAPAAGLGSGSAGGVPSGGGVIPAEVAEHVQMLLQRQQALQALQQEVQEQLLQLLPHSDQQ